MNKTMSMSTSKKNKKKIKKKDKNDLKKLPIRKKILINSKLKNLFIKKREKN
jgi:hypothetical protein